MLGGSEVVVETSIASYDLMHASSQVPTVRRRAPASLPSPTHTTMMRHGHQIASKCDSELSISQKRAKYAKLGDPELVVGTCITSYDLT